MTFSPIMPCAIKYIVGKYFLPDRAYNLTRQKWKGYLPYFTCGKPRHRAKKLLGESMTELGVELESPQPSV